MHNHFTLISRIKFARCCTQYESTRDVTFNPNQAVIITDTGEHLVSQMRN